MTDFSQIVSRYIARHRMLVDGRCVLVALSGGADSVALLRVLLELGYQCHAVHCNFQLRGEESERDEQFVRQLCNDLGVPLQVRRFDVAEHMRTTGESLEMACRSLRYEWFRQLLFESLGSCMAIAHHRDDNIETLLLNLLRGTGIAGVAGIKPVSGAFVRPLLDVTRQQIEQYLQELGQDYVTDSTNAHNDVKRNRLRNIILPALRREFPDADAGLTRSLESLQSCNELYDAMLPEWTGRMVSNHRSCSYIDIDQISQMEQGAEGLLFECLRGYGFNSVQAHDMLQAYRRGYASGKTFLSDGYRAVIDRDCVTVMERAEHFDKIFIDLNSDGITEPIKLKINKISGNGFDPASCDGRWSVCFGGDLALCPELELRHWQRGDRMRPFGMKRRSRLISDIFRDLKFNDAQKRDTWLLAYHTSVLWIIGHRSSEEFRVRPGDDTVYCFTASVE